MKTLSEYTFPPTYNFYGELCWTPREEQRLYNSYTKIDREKLLLIFPDRTWEAIRQRANKLKLERINRFTDEEDRMLLKLRKCGVPYKEIQKHMPNRSKYTMSKRHHRLINNK